MCVLYSTVTDAGNSYVGKTKVQFLLACVKTRADGQECTQKSSNERDQKEEKKKRRTKDAGGEGKKGDLLRSGCRTRYDGEETTVVSVANYC